MYTYFTLFFRSAYGHCPILKKWLLQHGQEIRAGEGLLVYGEGVHEKIFVSEISGVLKALLCQEGETLHREDPLAVFSMLASDAARFQKKGLGKVLEPEELKSALEHAEAASIRLPFK